MERRSWRRVRMCPRRRGFPKSRLEFAIPGTKLPQLIRYYRAPSYVERPEGHGGSAWTCSPRSWAAGQTSRLYQIARRRQEARLQRGRVLQRLLRAVQASFGVYATPRDGVSFDTLETAMDQIIRYDDHCRRPRPANSSAPRRVSSPSTPISRTISSSSRKITARRSRSGSPSPTSRIGRTASRRGPARRCAPRRPDPSREGRIRHRPHAAAAMR